MKAYYEKKWILKKCEYVLAQIVIARADKEKKFYEEACRPRWWRKRELTHKEALDNYKEAHFYLSPSFKYMYGILRDYCKDLIDALELTGDTHVQLDQDEVRKLTLFDKSYDK